MDIAEKAVAILASYLTDEGEPENEFQKHGIEKKMTLQNAICNRFSQDGDTEALKLLESLKAAPYDEELKASLVVILRQKFKEYPDFAGIVEGLIGQKGKGIVKVSRSRDNKRGGFFGGDSNEKARGSGIVSATRNLRLPEKRQSEKSQSETQLPEQLIRYPLLKCQDKAVLNQSFSLFVRLQIEAPEPDSQAIAIEDTGIPEKLPEVQVVISAHGFDIDGSNCKVLKLDRDRDSEEVFTLIPRDSGTQEVRADFYQHGRRIGTVRRNVLVGDAITEEIKLEQPGPSAALELKTTPTVSPPDLELYVELDVRDGRTLYFRLHSSIEEVGYHYAKRGFVTLQGSPMDKLKVIYDEMGRLAGQPGSDAERRMAAIGNNLWDELIPEDLKREYWVFKYRVHSLLITSDEPWIPWEMMKPYRYNEEGEREDDPFWCQQFFFSRWLSGPGTVEEFHAGPAHPIAPSSVNLSAVQDEVNLIENIEQLTPEIRGEPPLEMKEDVLNLIESGSFFILHFASHGKFDAAFPDNSAILLSDGPLRPSDIQTRFGGKRPRPLIFINACEEAQMEFSLTGLGGWAERLVNSARVGAFAGAIWDVNDVLALLFAKTFYTAFLQERKTIAQAFRESREEVRKQAPSNSTWLAYVLYADPEGRIKSCK